MEETGLFENIPNQRDRLLTICQVGQSSRPSAFPPLFTSQV